MKKRTRQRSLAAGPASHRCQGRSHVVTLVNTLNPFQRQTVHRRVALRCGKIHRTGLKYQRVRARAVSPPHFGHVRIDVRNIIRSHLI